MAEGNALAGLRQPNGFGFNRRTPIPSSSQARSSSSGTPMGSIAARSNTNRASSEKVSTGRTKLCFKAPRKRLCDEQAQAARQLCRGQATW